MTLCRRDIHIRVYHTIYHTGSVHDVLRSTQSECWLEPEPLSERLVKLFLSDHLKSRFGFLTSIYSYSQQHTLVRAQDLESDCRHQKISAISLWLRKIAKRKRSRLTSSPMVYRNLFVHAHRFKCCKKEHAVDQGPIQQIRLQRQSQIRSSETTTPFAEDVRVNALQNKQPLIDLEIDLDFLAPLNHRLGHFIFCNHKHSCLLLLF